MGIVVSSDKLRPYHNIPQYESDEETGHVSINLEVPSRKDGMPVLGVNEFSQKRWKKMLGGTKQHRLAPKRNGK